MYDCSIDRRSRRHTGGQQSFANNSIYGCFCFSKKKLFDNFISMRSWILHWCVGSIYGQVAIFCLQSTINDLWGNIEMKTTKRKSFEILLTGTHMQRRLKATKRRIHSKFSCFQSLPSILLIPINLTSAHLKQNVFCLEDSILSIRK